MMFTVFADSNIFLDALLDRPIGNIACTRILELAEQRSLKLFTSSSCLVNVLYFLQKASITKSEQKDIITHLLSFTFITSPDANTFLSALNAGFNDLEDAIQYYTALQVKGIDYFLTSNTKDFKKATVALPVLTPKEFLKTLEAK